MVTIYDAVESDCEVKPTVQQLGKKYFIAGQAMYVKRNIEARSCKHFFPWKSNKYYILSVCVCLCVCVCVCVCVCSLNCPACAVLCCHLWSLRPYSVFPPFFINDAIFGEKLLNIKRVFLFSLQILSKTCHILRRIQRDIVILVHRSSGNVSVFLVRFE